MYESKFQKRELFKRATCPFCGMLIEKPRELTTRMPQEMPVGSCSCGAVYACDVTGHNLGAAMIEALVFGCNMDADLAWGLLPEEDYMEEIVENYDYVNHLVIPGGFYEGRRISGALFFVRLHEDVQEVTSTGVQKRLEQAGSLESKKRGNRSTTKPLSKKEIEEYVRQFDFDPIVSVAGHDRKLIRNLQRLLYSGDDLFRKRAAEILGRACAVIGEKDPGTVSKLLQGLFYSISDTAAFTWGAFEAIGEIIRHRPDMFAGYVPQLYQYLPDKTRRAQVIEVIGRISQQKPDLFRKSTFHFIPFLNDPDPVVRGYTAWLLGNLRADETREDLEKIRQETNEIPIYENGELKHKTLGTVATEALEKLGR